MTYTFFIKIRWFFYRLCIMPFIKSALGKCGKNVTIGTHCNISGIQNIEIGDYSSIGSNALILCTKARLVIGHHVMIAPQVSIVTGNHKIDTVGKYMSEITDREKSPENDQDIIIKDDVWIGSNAILLKGITIGEGAVVAAGSIVTKNVEPYSIVAGVPAKIVKKRFTENQLQQHFELIKKR